jgi:hypothetical protein
LDGDAADIGRNLRRALDAEVEDGNAGALRGQRPRRRLAEAGATASDDRNLAVRVPVGVLQPAGNMLRSATGGRNGIRTVTP